MTGLVTLGETMGLFRPATPGQGGWADDFRLSFGGAESNVAIGVARLGEASAWIGRVGDDLIGRRILRELRAERVRVHATTDAAAATGMMLKSTPTPGRTSVQYWRGGSAGSRLDRADIDTADIGSARILHVTGITAALSAGARDALEHAVGIARNAGTVVSFDVNHRPSLWRDEDPRPILRELASASDIVFAGREEAVLLVGEADEETELVERIAALGPTTVALKLGDRGCLVLSGGSIRDRDAIAVSVVDTVGAGDAFVAGFLADTLRDEPVTRRIDTAVAAGAFACLGPGDWESLPDRAQIETLLGPADDPVIR